jgi:hypothetical protein
MGCFKVIQEHFGPYEDKGREWDIHFGGTYYGKIEVHHEGPVVEKEVPVLSKPLPGGNRVKTWEIVKLPICKSCGMVVFEKEENNGQKK